MTPTLKAVETAALALNAAERAELIERLVDTVLPTKPLHPEWEPEIRRRLADLDSGRAKAVPAEKVFAEMGAMVRTAKPGKPDA